MRTLIGSVAAIALLAGCKGGDQTSPADKKSETPAQSETSAKLAGSAVTGQNAYFGDLHIHTKNSFDAYIFNVRNTPDDVYRFARGETIRHPAGYDISIWGEPLDFVAATDHGAYMGVLPAMHDPESPLSKVELAKGMFSSDPDDVTAAFGTMGGSVRSGEPYPEIYDRDLIDSTWQNAIAVANKHYVPGKLTTFAAYEYTAVSTQQRDDNSFIGGNLHRNVVFRDNAPDRLFATLDSVNPEDLWDWMDKQRASGNEVMAIPHNSNVSDGEMFDLKTYDGAAITKEYAEQRIRNEPIVEMTQVKGTSETHPALSPNDEWANFEIYEYLLSSDVQSKINGSYIRESLARGLGIEQDTGVNPYKFGLIGASDTHVAGGAFDEKDYWSKVGILDATPESRGSIPPDGAKSWDGIEMWQPADLWFSAWGASGLAVVWANENTREGIYDAMARKETYATSGPRHKVRFFAAKDYADGLVNRADFVEKAYEGGVPMGGTLSGTDGSPEFLVWAMRDARSAPLQRAQIIKVWHDGGQNKEKVYDVACSDGLTPDPATHRCPDNGASVDLSDCSVSKDKGAPELKASWSDPNFDAGQSAAYYVRVLENPTCRWSTWDALKAGVEPNPKLQKTLQERSWTSPIWYDAQ